MGKLLFRVAMHFFTLSSYSQNSGHSLIPSVVAELGPNKVDSFNPGIKVLSPRCLVSRMGYGWRSSKPEDNG